MQRNLITELTRDALRSTVQRETQAGNMHEGNAERTRSIANMTQNRRGTPASQNKNGAIVPKRGAASVTWSWFDVKRELSSPPNRLKH